MPQVVNVSLPWLTNLAEIHPFWLSDEVVIRQKKAWRRREGVFVYFEDTPNILGSKR